MEVISIATVDTIFIEQEKTLYDAIEIMYKRKLRRLPVIHGSNQVVGIITIRDIMHLLAKQNIKSLLNTSISKLMTPNPLTIRADASVIEAANIMAQQNIGSLLLITDDSGTCGGIITERDLVKHFASAIADATLEPFYRKNIAIITPEATLKDALDAMVKHNTRRVIISKDKKTLDGILTATDLIKYIHENHDLLLQTPALLKRTKAMDYATKQVIAFSSTASVKEVTQVMLEKNIGAVPVLHNGTLDGKFTERDLLLLIAQYGLLPD